MIRHEEILTFGCSHLSAKELLKPLQNFLMGHRVKRSLFAGDRGPQNHPYFHHTTQVRVLTELQ